MVQQGTCIALYKAIGKTLSLLRMLKRISILCYLLAFVALQVHNATPHYHQEEINFHHHNDQQNHDEVGKKSPVNAHHDSEFGKSIVKPEGYQCQVEKPVLFVGSFILLFDELSNFYHVTPKIAPRFNSSLHSIFVTHNVPLRAPPVAYTA